MCRLYELFSPYAFASIQVLFGTFLSVHVSDDHSGWEESSIILYRTDSPISLQRLRSMRWQCPWTSTSTSAFSDSFWDALDPFNTCWMNKVGGTNTPNPGTKKSLTKTPLPSRVCVLRRQRNGFSTTPTNLTDLSRGVATWFFTWWGHILVKEWPAKQKHDDIIRYIYI